MLFKAQKIKGKTLTLLRHPILLGEFGKVITVYFWEHVQIQGWDTLKIIVKRTEITVPSIWGTSKVCVLRFINGQCSKPAPSFHSLAG
jgi:hypothetical protein